MSDETLHYELFASLIGHAFNIQFVDGSIDLTLEEVTPLPGPQRISPDTSKPVPLNAPNVRQKPFTILFRGPANVRLPQHTYRMTEPSLSEPLDIFIVPVKGEPKGFVYQAVFT